MICTFIQLCVDPKGCPFIFKEHFFTRTQTVICSKTKLEEIDNRIKFDYVSKIWCESSKTNSPHGFSEHFFFFLHFYCEANR